MILGKYIKSNFSLYLHHFVVAHNFRADHRVTNIFIPNKIVKVELFFANNKIMHLLLQIMMQLMIFRRDVFVVVFQCDTTFIINTDDKFIKHIILY